MKFNGWSADIHIAKYLDRSSLVSNGNIGGVCFWKQSASSTSSIECIMRGFQGHQLISRNKPIMFKLNKTSAPKGKTKSNLHSNTIKNIPGTTCVVRLVIVMGILKPSAHVQRCKRTATLFQHSHSGNRVIPSFLYKASSKRCPSKKACRFSII